MIEKISLFLLIIIALFTWVLFILNVYFHMPLTAFSTAAVLIVVTLMIYLTVWGKFRISPSTPNKKLFGSEKILLGLLMAVIGANMLLNWYRPPTEWDSLVNYDYRAKIFFNTHNIQDINEPFYGTYPLFTSLAHSVFYLWGLNPKVFYSILVILFTGLFYAKLEQKIGRRGALTGSLLILTTPIVFNTARWAYLNFAYMAYLGMSLIYLVNFLEDRKKQNLIIFSLFMAIASWVRAAHHPFFAANLFIIFLWSLKKHSLKNTFIPIIFYLGVFGPWFYFQYHILNITTYESTNLTRFVTNGLPNPFLPSLWEVVKRIFLILTDISYSGGVGIAFLILTALQLFKGKGFGKISTAYFVILINLLAWIGLSLLLQTEIPQFNHWIEIVADSMGRIFTFFFPILIYTMFQLPIIVNVWKKKN